MGGATLPPGFRFHPTDEELVGYYLKRKVEGLEIELEVIPVVDLYKYDPWELPEKSFLPKRDMEWFFFCPRDRKYPNGSRTNRATRAGYWKATGKDRKVVCQSASATGYRKTLVFYRGRAPLGDRTDWVMHEYRLCDGMKDGSPNFQGGFALCRIIKRNESGSKTTQSSGETSKTKRVGSSSSFVDLTSTTPSEVDPFNNIVSSGDISSQTSLQYNEGSQFSSPVNSSSNCNYAVGKMPEFMPAPLQANSADFWVSQDLILDSSKDYQQLHQPAASEFSQSHELQASMNQWQPYNNNHREFSPTSSYSNLTGEFEFSGDLTRIGCTSLYENYASFEGTNQYMSFEGYDQTNSLYYNDNLF